MAMQSDGQIKWSEIQSTHGGSGQIAISEYYGKYYTPGGDRRPTSGMQKASYLYSTSPSVDGDWSSYGSWGDCSVDCGGGTQTRTRTCTSPAPSYGGANCSGSATQSQSCNTHPCQDPPGSQGFSSNGTFTVPIGYSTVSYEIIGGGGGGQAGKSYIYESGKIYYVSTYTGKGGFGATSYSSGTLSVTSEETLSVVVGAGGAGGAGESGCPCTENVWRGGNQGSAGGTSQIKRGGSVLVNASGGSGTTGGESWGTGTGSSVYSNNTSGALISHNAPASGGHSIDGSQRGQGGSGGSVNGINESTCCYNIHSAGSGTNGYVKFSWS